MLDYKNLPTEAEYEESCTAFDLIESHHRQVKECVRQTAESWCANPDAEKIIATKEMIARLARLSAILTKTVAFLEQPHA